MEEINTLENALCKAVTSSEMGRCTRRDLLFEKKQKGGINMTSIKELYEINRCRTIGQLIENGKRQEGRGQIPWATQIIMEEIMSADPCMEIYKEINRILTKLHLQKVINKDYKSWNTQRMLITEQHINNT